MVEESFKDRTILVTGGSRGIGRATSIRLASEGARVAVNYVSNVDQANQTVDEITSSGGKAVAICGDVSKPSDASKITEETRRVFGPIDMLVHSAGVSIVEPADEVTWETWRKTMDINLDGTYNMVYAVKDEMIERQFGRIVLLSSVAALRERENQVHYSASKAAVIAMGRCMAQAWAKHNLRINSVCPGLIDTDMAYTLSPETHTKVVEATPMGRLGTADEIASVIRFLLSDESRFMTGQTIAASGGRVMLPG